MAIDLLEQIHPHIKNSIYPLRLALPDWRMKEGESSAAASISLSDKSWMSIRIPFQWGKYDKTFWFRQTIKVQPEFSGKPLVLLLDFQEALLYLNGKPCQGIDQYHKEILLCEKSKLNEQFVIAVQAYSGRKHEHSTFAFAELAVLDPVARRLDSGLNVLQDLDKLMEHGSQESKEIRELMHRTLIFLKYFKPGSEEYPNAIRRAYNFLLNTLDIEFKTTLPGLVSLISHSRLDPSGLWTSRNTSRKCVRTFSTALKLMEEFPEFKFSQSQTVLYEFIKVHYPDLYKQVKQRFSEGRWEVLGTMWTEADCNIPNGESLVRQILFGKRFFKQEFGIDLNTLWLPNSFGFNWALPQILRKAGITNFYTSELSANDTTKFPYASFWWQGIDKTKILSHVSPIEFEGQLSPKIILKNWTLAQQQQSISSVLQPFGYGDNGGGVTKESLEFAVVLKTIVGLPSSQLSTVHEFFSQLEKQSDDLPTWDNELYLEAHRGIYTSQAWIKKENRKCENSLFTAELLSTITLLQGKNVSSRQYPKQELMQAWKKLLLNQSYNIISGTSIADVHGEIQQDYYDIKNKCSTIIDNCINGISQPVKRSKKEFHYTLFNPMCWQRNEYVELFVKSGKKNLLVHDADGKPVAHQIIERSKDGQTLLCYIENIPPLGFKNIIVTIQQNAAKPSDLWKTSSHGIETPYYRVRFDNKGSFSSLYTKHLRRELFQKGKRGNCFATFRDIPKQWEAWNIDADYEKHRVEIWKIKQCKITEQGPLRASVRLELRTENGSVLLQNIRFYHQSPRIDFQTHIRWLEKQILLKVAFPFNIKSPNLTYEIPFGAINRPLKPHTDWERAKFEVPAQQWADMSDVKYGVSLLNDCKYGHDAKENTLRLTLLRSPHYPHPMEPSHSDNGFMDQGEHSFCYALSPHSGDWNKGDTVKHAFEINHPIIIFPNIRVEGFPSLIISSKPNIIVDSIKKAEDDPHMPLYGASKGGAERTGNAVIIRLHEAHGVATGSVLQFGVDATYAIECDLLENDQKQHKIVRSRLPLKFKPFEIKTIKLIVKVPKKKR